MTAGVYLDYNATAKLRPQAMKDFVAAMRLANPRASTPLDAQPGLVIEQARDEVAALVRAKAEAVIFAGGAEANALAVDSAARGKIERIVSGLLNAARRSASARQRPTGRVWPIDRDGLADLQWLSERLSRTEARRWSALCSPTMKPESSSPSPRLPRWSPASVGGCMSMQSRQPARSVSTSPL